MKRFSLILILTIILLQSQAQTIELCFVDSNNPSHVQVDVTVNNFKRMVIMQLPIFYNDEILRYDSVTNFVFASNVYGFFSHPGDTLESEIRMSWDDHTFQGQTLPDSTILFSLHFTRINHGDFHFDIIENNQDFPYEAIDFFGFVDYTICDNILSSVDGQYDLVKVQIWPNPTSDYLNIRTYRTGSFIFNLIDLSGNSLISRKFYKELQIDFNLADGVYVAQIINISTLNVMSTKILVVN